MKKREKEKINTIDATEDRYFPNKRASLSYALSTWLVRSLSKMPPKLAPNDQAPARSLTKHLLFAKQAVQLRNVLPLELGRAKAQNNNAIVCNPS